jgi:hypothetical protein
MAKCPSCGYEYESGDKSADIRNLLFRKKKKTRKLLKKSGELIMANVPSDNKQYKFFAFLYYITKIDDDIINWATNIYLNHKEYKKGKGFAYLRGMIQNADKDYKVKSRAELKLLGKTPKSLKEKRKELGYANRDNVSS